MHLYEIIWLSLIINYLNYILISYILITYNVKVHYGVRKTLWHGRPWVLGAETEKHTMGKTVLMQEFMK